MSKNRTINLQLIEKVALGLGEINDEVVYVGGAIISLYITDEGAEPPRPTKDIDISVQISTYAQMDELRERLSLKKFYPAPTESVMYRYAYEGILVDFIPFEATPLGPTNSWLKPGFDHAYPIKIGQLEINILPVSLFLATKWEAYKSRGSDPRTSHDFEDIIYLIDNNLEILENVLNAAEDVQRFLKEMSREILGHPSRNEIIECHLNPYTANERREMVVEKLKRVLE